MCIIKIGLYQTVGHGSLLSEHRHVALNMTSKALGQAKLPHVFVINQEAHRIPTYADMVALKAVRITGGNLTPKSHPTAARIDNKNLICEYQGLHIDGQRRECIRVSAITGYSIVSFTACLLSNYKCDAFVQVDAAGFTLAPLQPQFRSGGSDVSHSCLVTFVLKIDLGGYLSEKSPFGLYLPWSQQIAESFLHSMLTSVMALRDTVSPALRKLRSMKFESHFAVLYMDFPS